MFRCAVLFTFIINITLGQNLVPNPSFENVQNVPCSWAGTPAQYSTSMSNWMSPTRGTTDIFSMQSPTSCYSHCFSTNQYAIGEQLPRTGDHMSNLIAFGLGCGPGPQPNYREYLHVQLVNPLVVGNTYYAEYYVSLPERTYNASNNLGMYFSVDSINTYTCFNLNYMPQIVDTNIITDSVNWVKISGTFVATEPYEYLTLGNMFDDNQTDTTTINDNYHLVAAYYFVDDVSVEEVSCQSSTTSLNICSGESLTLTNNSNTIVGWANAQNPGTILSTNNQFTVSPSSDQIYFCYTGCDTATFHVYYQETPSVDLGPDTLGLCELSSLTLSAYDPTDPFYEWNSSYYQTDSVFTVTNEGTYWVELDDHGCTASDTVFVDYDPLEDFSMINDIYLCDGETATVTANVPEGAAMLWEDGDTTAENSFSTEGIYTLEVSKLGCTKSDSIYIIYWENPIAELGEDTSFCNQNFSYDIVLNTNDTNIVWENGLIRDTIRTVSSPGIYYVKVENLMGCESSDTIKISLDDCGTLIKMPNIFTPNNDGVNDNFIPVVSQNIHQPILQIFNRWGQLIFETENLNTGWSGSVKESEAKAPEGTYFWTIQYEDAFGKQDSKSGSLYLSR